MATSEQVQAAIDRKRVEAAITRKKEPEFDAVAAMDRFKSGEPLPAIEGFRAGGEIINSLIGGVGGPVVGGLTGIPGMVAGTEEAVSNIENVQESMSRPPESEVGQKSVQKMGELMQQGLDLINIPLAESAKWIEEISGATPEDAEQVKQDVLENGFTDEFSESVYEQTGSAFLGALAKAAPELVPMLIGTFSGQGLKNKAVKKQKLFDEIKKGSTDPNITKLGIKASPLTGVTGAKVTPTWKEALRQGFDEGSLSIIQNASKADQLRAQRMVNILKRRKRNPLLRQELRPSNVLGQSMVRRIEDITRANNTAASQLNRTAKALSGKKVDAIPAVQKLLDDLDDVLAVRVGADFKPIFSGSNVDDLAAPQKAIKRILQRVSETVKDGQIDAFRAHQMKKFIDEVLSAGKAKGLAGQTTTVLGDFRKSINGVLRDNFDDYKRINTTFSETKTILDQLQDIAGKKIDLTGRRSAKALGTLLKQRMMGNAQSRVPLMNAVDDIENIARKYGGTYTDNLKVQRDFVEMLDKTIREQVAPTAFQGEGVKMGRKVLTGSKAEIAADLTESALNKLRGINDDAAIKAIDEFLKDL